MNESKFRRLVRTALRRPPQAPRPEGVHASLIERSDRRRRRAIVAVGFGLAPVVVVVLLGGYWLFGLTQRPIISSSRPPVTAAPTSLPRAASGATPTPTPGATSIPAAAAPRFTSFRLSSFSNPGTTAVVGPDGAVWFTIHNPSPGIGSISATGQVRTYPLPGTQSAVPLSITAGPDAGVWFTRGDLRSSGPAVIGRLAVDGSYSEYPIPPRITDVGDLVAGPDGNVWFTDSASNKIGRMTPAGQVREFALPSYPAAQCGQLCPGSITVGPDGALWFANTQLAGVPGIGRITTDGLVSLFSLPTGSVPGAITAGPDGNLWFTEDRGPGLGRLTTDGSVTEFAIPGFQHAGVAALSLTEGPDAAIWFTISDLVSEASPTATVKPGQLGRITTAGIVTMYTPPGEGTTGAIVPGRDGSLWAFGSSTVTRVTFS
jgi:virginiamycin B lyase